MVVFRFDLIPKCDELALALLKIQNSSSFLLHLDKIFLTSAPLGSAQVGKI